MSKMQSLEDFLGDITKNYKKDIDKARDGVQGSWDTSDMPVTREYRATITGSQVKMSNAGNQQIVLTYTVTEPEEFAGRLLQDYIATDAKNEMSARKFAETIGALSIDLSGLSGNDYENLAQRFLGANAVVALRAWGDDLDKRGIRWTNSDRGQVLKMDVKPIKPKVDGKALRPDVVVRKADPEPSYNDGEPEDPKPAPPAQLPGTRSTSGGPNLPPGLRKG